MATVVITGSSGFIGKQLVRALLTEKRKVIATDRFSGVLENVFGDSQGLQRIEADLKNSADVVRLADHVPSNSYLVHLAGQVLPSANALAEYNEIDAIDTNIKGTCLLLKLLQHKLSGACLASTLDVYGRPVNLPITEDHPVLPVTFYGASKLAAEYYARVYLRNIPLAITRFSHVYGPGDPHPKVLRSFIQSVRQGMPPVIHGDGQDLRDYIHVNDLAKTLAEICRIRPSGVFNIASGTSMSLRDLAELTLRIAALKIEPQFKTRRHERWDYVFDVSRIRETLHFFPRINLERGIAEILSCAHDADL